jgi:hypothetical protein
MLSHSYFPLSFVMCTHVLPIWSHEKPARGASEKSGKKWENWFKNQMISGRLLKSAQ